METDNVNKTGDVNAKASKPKMSKLEERGYITVTEGDKKVTFRHISADELKSRRCSAYKYLV